MDLKVEQITILSKGKFSAVFDNRRKESFVLRIEALNTKVKKARDHEIAIRVLHNVKNIMKVYTP